MVKYNFHLSLCACSPDGGATAVIYHLKETKVTTIWARKCCTLAGVIKSTAFWFFFFPSVDTTDSLQVNLFCSFNNVCWNIFLEQSVSVVKVHDFVEKTL